MNMSTPTGKWGPCCSTAATGRTATTLLISVAAKSRQLISAQNLVGSTRFSSRLRRTRGDGLDLDLEFGARESLNDHQRGRRRRIAYKFVTHLHIAAQIFGRSDVRIQPDDVVKRHGGLAKDCSNCAKAKPRLTLGVIGNDAVSIDPQLPRTKYDARFGVDFDSVRVIGEWGMDRVWIQSAHRHRSPARPPAGTYCHFPPACLT